MRLKKLKIILTVTTVMAVIGLDLFILQAQLFHSPSSEAHFESSLLELSKRISSQLKTPQDNMRSSWLGVPEASPRKNVDSRGRYNFLIDSDIEPKVMEPHVFISAGRTGVDFVLGVPSVKRRLHKSNSMYSYLYKTLSSLINGLADEDRNKVLIIVFLAEPWDEAYEEAVITNLMTKFGEHISNGLIDVITPKQDFYPDLTQIKLSLGDDEARVKWRSKQNLDYAYLMFHAWRRGKYYIQMEDDISAKPGYITSIEKSMSQQYWDWFLLEFSSLGFIGRLFKSTDVPRLMTFLVMFYSEKPCDMLLEDFLKVHSCLPGWEWSKCLLHVRNIARPMQYSQFQHQGYHSSLNATFRKVKDWKFSRKSQWINPPTVHIFTTISSYRGNDIYRAYTGNGFFWGPAAQPGDLIDFLFDPALPIGDLKFVTGNWKNQKDLLTDAVVEVLPETLPSQQNKHDLQNTFQNLTLGQNKPALNHDGPGPTNQEERAHRRRMMYLPRSPPEDAFSKVGEFDMYGQVNCEVPAALGPIHVVRIRVRTKPQTWVLLNKIIIRLRHNVTSS